MLSNLGYIQVSLHLCLPVPPPPFPEVVQVYREEQDLRTYFQRAAPGVGGVEGVGPQPSGLWIVACQMSHHYGG